MAVRLGAALMLISALLHQSSSLLLLPLLGASLYQAYLEQGIRFRENPWLGNEPILEEYDFVVVGSGPGGSAVANRLTENGRWKLLLLEAGGDENVYTDVPATVSHWSLGEYDWGYAAERTGNACLAMEQQRCLWPRGKILGGSSTLNYMIYTRGHRRDYDAYAAAGNYGWSYEQLLPYFVRSENNTIAEYRNSSLHGHAGPLHVERVRHRTPLVDAFVAAGHELGYAAGDAVDYTDGAPHGFSRIQTTQWRGRRVSAAKAYLRSARGRRNLHVAISARVTRLLVDERGRAYGVEFFKAGRRRVVRARKEVIVSAGALNSPQLLMLSGIGPAKHLRRLGIPVVRDLRGVGRNLHEHYSFAGLSFVVNVTGAALTSARVNIASFLDWLREGRGPLTLPGAVEGLAYVSSKYNEQPADYPDIEYIFAAGSFASDGGTDMRRSFGITERMYWQAFGQAHLKDTWTVLPMLLRPRTTGRLLLRDANPWHAPLFYYNYFEDPHDMKVLVEGIKGVLALSETEAFRKLGSLLTPVHMPECAHHAFKSDEYWACMARYFTGTLHHQSGTCKMGPATDPSAVVDPELRVHGVRNLRVVDASIFPKLPAAHLYAPTLMVGEKAADMIARAWAHEQSPSSTHANQAAAITATTAAPSAGIESKKS